MKIFSCKKILKIFSVIIMLCLFSFPSPAICADNPNPPSSPVRLIFIHHSCGENWLAARNGNLRQSLNANKYYVLDVSYSWGPTCVEKGSFIGDHTDIPDWYLWFTGSNRNTYLSALYTSNENAGENNGVADPGGQNEIIMFKSCYPNSDIDGNPNDSPASSADYNSPITVANAKRIYLDARNYFATRQDKLFVVITAPPEMETHTTPERATNARAFNTWLVNNWLAGYSHHNVAVFDFYNVLTSNGGAWNINDLGSTAGNHHRYGNNVIEYITNQGSNYAAYPNNGNDDHPSPAGNQKATSEFVPLLNIAYHKWKETPPSQNKSIRLYGETRYETAVAISKEGWASSDKVVLARGDLFPDALAGAPLAAKYNAPILLTNPEYLTASTQDEIIRLKAKEVFILGSGDAVSGEVVSDLENKCSIANANIHRYGGVTRYETAYEIAKQLSKPANKTAIIATGENYPDALSAASVAAYKGMPILLVKGGLSPIPDATQQALKDLGIESVALMGGEDVIPAHNVEWFAEQNYKIQRYAGDTRYDTCKEIANWSLTLGMGVKTIALAVGENFPDALTIGPLAAKNKAPLILVREFVPKSIEEWVSQNKGKINTLYIAGGPDVVSEDVVSQIKTLAGI